jgi:hypothetical protein
MRIPAVKPTPGGAKMPRFVGPLSVVLFSLLVACSDSTSPLALSVNRMRWDKQNLHDYSYTGRRFCFCPPGSDKEVLVIVLSDTVYSARVVGTTVELPQGDWPTVKQLFGVVQSSYSSDTYDEVRVKYDPALGYPTLIDLSCPDTIADCGFRLEIKNLAGLVSLY